MRVVSIVILFFILLLCVFHAPPSSFALCVEVGKASPNLELTDIDGKKVSLDAYRGKIILLAFWASWCPRCEEELTFLQGVYKTSPDIVVIAINQEAQNISRAHVARIKETLTQWKIDFPVLIDRELLAWDMFCINALPTSIIIDKAGKIRYAEANYYWASQDKIANIINEIRTGK
ncbi:MAG: redoxin domain-containing protein [Deltaproteobacteria bacterium]|nr:redoxin domain-containing protein [Deltaproteobacteria bacterium]NIS76925.1 redoxin domain-containing protein [Deltaproteobacteria bacterium]